MNDQPHIQILRMSDSMVPPKFATDGSAGCDLYASEARIMDPGIIMTIPLGFATDMPDTVHARIESRSGLALRGLVVLTGVIDSDYRGEWMVILKNCTNEAFEIKVGDRIAQAVFRPTVKPTFETVESLTDTARGAGGFGSTGTS